jgi:hypothetical protein
MADNFELWLTAELAYRKRTVLSSIDGIESTLVGLRARVNDDSYLNDLGELQASGVMLDTAVAAYAVQRQVMANYQRELKK